MKRTAKDSKKRLKESQEAVFLIEGGGVTELLSTNVLGCRGQNFEKQMWDDQTSECCLEKGGATSGMSRPEKGIGDRFGMENLPGGKFQKAKK